MFGSNKLEKGIIFVTVCMEISKYFNFKKRIVSSETFGGNVVFDFNLLFQTKKHSLVDF